jgi:signal transducing adaptor molecule
MLREPQSKEYVGVLFSPCVVLIYPPLSIDYKFEPSMEPPPNEDDETRRREEEELQRVLELSMQDKGGRRNWNEYSLASSSSAGGSSSQASTQANTARPPPPAAPSSSSSSAPAPAPAYNQHAYSTGFVPSTETHVQTSAPPVVESSSQSTSTAPTSPTSSTTEGYAVTRVRALHSFEPTEPNELAFEKGDIIKVVNREYKDWWRGQIRGRTGIFPVNYVVRLHVHLHAFASAYVLMAFRNLFRNPLRPSWQPKRSRKLPCSHKRPMWIGC